jgi:hypothetical protein
MFFLRQQQQRALSNNKPSCSLTSKKLPNSTPGIHHRFMRRTKVNAQEEEQEEENDIGDQQSIDIRDDEELLKIGLKWSADYSELIDIKTGKPLEDFDSLQKKQKQNERRERFDIALRAMRGEFTKAKGQTEDEQFGEILEAIGTFPSQYIFQASAKVYEEHDVLRVRQEIKQCCERYCKEIQSVEIKPRGKKFHSFWVKGVVESKKCIEECVMELKSLNDIVTCC